MLGAPADTPHADPPTTLPTGTRRLPESNTAAEMPATLIALKADFRERGFYRKPTGRIVFELLVHLAENASPSLSRLRGPTRSRVRFPGVADGGEAMRRYRIFASLCLLLSGCEPAGTRCWNEYRVGSQWSGGREGYMTCCQPYEAEGYATPARPSGPATCTEWKRSKVKP